MRFDDGSELEFTGAAHLRAYVQDDRAGAEDPARPLLLRMALRRDPTLRTVAGVAVKTDPANPELLIAG